MNIRKRYLLVAAVPLFVWAVIMAVLAESGTSEKHEDLRIPAPEMTNATVDVQYHATLTAIAVKGQQTQTATAATAAVQ